jgi:hypothetical protein
MTTRTPTSVPVENLKRALKDHISNYERKSVLEQLGLRKESESKTFIVKMKIEFDIDEYEDYCDEDGDEVDADTVYSIIEDDAPHYMKLTFLEGAEVRQ